MSLLAALRRRLQRRRARDALSSFYSSAPPSSSTPIGEVPMLAVDLETSGLDAARDRILSLGWIPIDRLRLVMAGAREQLVAQPDAGTASTPIHGLLPSDLAEAGSEREAVATLLHALSGRALVAHAAGIELAFLDAACRRHFGAGLESPALCTLELERRLQAGQSLPPEGLRLHACRARHGLPQLAGHRAALDAQAAAELLLAQVEAFGGSGTRLGALLRR